MLKRLAFPIVLVLVSVCVVTGFATDFFKPYKGFEYSPSTPRWIKITKLYSDYATAATTNTITLYSLPANQMVVNVIMRHTTSFTGGSVSAVMGSVGITGQLQMFVSNSTLFSAPSATTFYTLTTPTTSVPLNASSATNITATLNSTGGNLSTLTAGSVDYYLCLSQLP